MKIITTILAISLAIFALQPIALAGRLVLVGVTSATCGLLFEVKQVETGTDAFRDAVSAAIGEASVARNIPGCEDAHILIVPAPEEKTM